MATPWIETFLTENCNIASRKGETSLVKKLTFLNSDGSGHDISSYNFEYWFYKTSFLDKFLFKLTVGVGMTITGADNNELNIVLTAAQSHENGTFFSLLKNTTADNAWLAGDWVVHSGKYTRHCEIGEDITIYTNGGTEVTITINTGGGSSGWAAEHDASAGAWPSLGSATFGEANEVKVTVAGTIGGIDVYPGDIMKAMQNDPDDSWNPLTGWRKL